VTRSTTSQRCRQTRIWPATKELGIVIVSTHRRVWASSVRVPVSGVPGRAYDGTFTVGSASPTEFTYTLSTDPGGSGSGGTASLPLPHAVTYTYDAESNRTQMADGTGTTTYTLDPFGEVTSVKNPTRPVGECNRNMASAGVRVGLSCRRPQKVAIAEDTRRGQGLGLPQRLGGPCRHVPGDAS